MALHEEVALSQEVQQHALIIQDPPSHALLIAEQAFNGDDRISESLEDLQGYVYPVSADTNPSGIQKRNYQDKTYDAWYNATAHTEPDFGGICIPSEDNASALRTPIFTRLEQLWLKNRTYVVAENYEMTRVLSAVNPAESMAVRTNIAARMLGVLAGFAAIPRILSSAHFVQRRDDILRLNSQAARPADVPTLHQQIDALPWEWPTRDLLTTSINPSDNKTTPRQAWMAQLNHSRGILAPFSDIITLTLEHDPDRFRTPVSELDPAELRSPFLVNSLTSLLAAIKSTGNPAARLDEFYRGIAFYERASSSPPSYVGREQRPQRQKLQSPVGAATAGKQGEHPATEGIQEGLQAGTANIVLVESSSKNSLNRAQVEEEIRFGLVATGHQLHRRQTGAAAMPAIMGLPEKDLLHALVGDYAGRIMSVRVILESGEAALQNHRISRDRQVSGGTVAAYIVVEKRNGGSPLSTYAIRPYLFTHRAKPDGISSVLVNVEHKLSDGEVTRMVQEYDLPEDKKR